MTDPYTKDLQARIAWRNKKIIREESLVAKVEKLHGKVYADNSRELIKTLKAANATEQAALDEMKAEAT